VLTQVMGLSLGLGKAAAEPQAGARSLRMMSYNIKSFRAEQQEGLYEALADEITRQAPDLLVMQDAPHLNRPGRLHPALRTALQAYQLHGFGQYVMASRFPLQDCRVGRMPIGTQAHTYLRCTVLVGDTPLTLLTAHTLTPREGLNATRSERLGGLDDWRENFAGRMAQARQLAADIAELPRPLIVAGDLNAPEHSPVVQVLLDEGLRDAYGTAGLGWGYTLGHALKPHLSFLRIDHILVSPDIGVLRAVAGSRQGSEHRPVVADLLLPR
jgi:endonuclease/exonuclease/phosphatase (EEP) superfamily protein YafD